MLRKLDEVLAGQQAVINAVKTQQNEETTKVGEIMSALTDLQAAVNNLGTSISAEIEAVTTKLQASIDNNSGSISPEDAQTVVTQLQALQSKIDQETTVLAPPSAQSGT